MRIPVQDAELLASIASLLGKPYPYDDFLATERIPDKPVP